MTVVIIYASGHFSILHTLWAISVYGTFRFGQGIGIDFGLSFYFDKLGNKGYNM